jgi:hypothetical protein
MILKRPKSFLKLVGKNLVVSKIDAVFPRRNASDVDKLEPKKVERSIDIVAKVEIVSIFPCQRFLFST